MSAFTGPLTITQVDVDWKLWRIEQPLRYEVGELGTGRVIEVPQGFETDGASVPRFLWWLLPAWGTYSRAAVVHDYLTRCIESGRAHPEGKTRFDCDKVLWEAAGVCGTPFLLRVFLFTGARIYALWRGRSDAREFPEGNGD